MKRYWKVITITAVILVTFAIYYLQPIIAKEELFELELATVEDAGNVGEGITIIGDIYESQQANGDYYNGAHYERFELDSEEMVYSNKLNYFEQLTNLHSSPKMERLKKDYRSFMRGKDSVELLYEDEETLAYIGPYGQNPENGMVRFEASILNKTSNDEEDFTLEVPLVGPMHFVNIIDVQLQDETLYILTTNYGQSLEEEMYLYQIDAAEEAVEGVSHLNDMIEGEFWLVNDYYTFGKETHYVFRKYEEVEGEGAFEDSFFSYHIETGEVNEMEVPDGWGVYENTTEEEINPFTIGNYAIKDEFMYFIQFTEASMVTVKYNLLKNTIESTDELSFDEETIAGLNLVYTEGDKVSLISTDATQGTKDRSMFVIDLLNNEIIYEGNINIANTSKELHVYDIDFYQIHLQ